MPIHYFGGRSEGGDRLEAFTDKPLWYDFGLPAGRLCMNGLHPVLVTAFSRKLAGRSAARSAAGYIENHGGGAGAGGNSGIPYHPSAAVHMVGFNIGEKFFAHGGESGWGARVTIFPSGSIWHARNSSGPGIVQDGGNHAPWYGSPVGWIDYFLVPTAPRLLAVTPNADGRSARVQFTFDGDQGGHPINRYRIEWALDPGFTQIVGRADTGTGDNQIGGLQPGRDYYWRVTACNRVSDLAGATGGQWSNSIGARQRVPNMNFGRIRNEADTAFVPATARIRNESDTGWLRAQMLIRNDADTAWLKPGR